MIRELILKELIRNRLRTVLTIMGVAIGIIMIVTLSSFSEGIKLMVNSEINFASGLITVIQSGISFQNTFASEIDSGLTDQIASISGVSDVTGFIMGFTDIGWIGGLDFEKVDMVSSLSVGLDEGRWPADGADEVAIGFLSKDMYGVVLGDSLKMKGKEYEVVGIVKETGSNYDMGIYTSISTAEDILGKEGKVTLILVKPADVSDSKDIAQEINDEFGDSEGVAAGTDEDVRKFAAQMTDQLSAMTFGLGSIASVIAGVVIMNVMFMAVRERRREIGVMKAVGATDRMIMVEIITEAVGISLVGAAAGLVLSVGSVAFLNGILGTGFAVITPSLAIEAVIFATVIGVLAGYAPARQAERLNPVEAIRYE